MGKSESARDKIEIKLEPRQVFILAAGTMVFSGLLFSAGFMLGRSAPLETNVVQPVPTEVIQGMTAAGQEGPAPVPTAAAVGEVEFLFPSALGSRPARKRPASKKVVMAPGEISYTVRADAQPQAKPATPTARLPVPKVRAIPKPRAAKKRRAAAAATVDEDFPLPRRLGGLTSASTARVKKRDSNVAKANSRLRAVVSRVDGSSRGDTPKDRTVKVTTPKAGVSKSTAKKSNASKSSPRSNQRGRTVLAKGSKVKRVSRPGMKRVVRSGGSRTYGSSKVKAATKRGAGTGSKPSLRTLSSKNVPKVTPVAQVAKVTKVAKVAKATRTQKLAKSRFTLQVKATRTQASAEAFMNGLRSKGYTPHLVLVDLPGRGRFYRVRLGKFLTMEQARRFQRAYKRKSGASDSGFVTRM